MMNASNPPNPPIANSHHHVTSGAPTALQNARWIPMDHPKTHQGASVRMHRPSRDTLTGPGVVPSVLLRLDDQWVETDKESYSSCDFFCVGFLFWKFFQVTLACSIWKQRINHSYSDGS